VALTRRGRFITLEGSEGSGKTTAARHLGDWLRSRGERVVVTREPGGTPLGDEVRRLVLHLRDVSDDLDPRADALLYAAARAQHTARIIQPALAGAIPTERAADAVASARTAALVDPDGESLAKCIADIEGHTALPMAAE